MNIDPGSIATAAKNVTYGGGVTAMWGAYSASELAAFGGLLVALAGFVVNYYFRRKDDRRAQALHDARMAELRNE